MTFADELVEAGIARRGGGIRTGLPLEPPPSWWREEEYAKDYSAQKRRQFASRGIALPDGSFPIADAGDLQAAVGLVGRYKGKYDAKAHVIKRARALGRTDLLPDSWK